MKFPEISGHDPALPPAKSQYRWIGIACMVFAVAIAAYLRFAGLGVSALWIDEVLLVRFTQSHALQEFVPQTAVWVFTHLFGSSEYVVRFPFALAGVLTVVFIPLVVRRSGAVAAMFVVATLPLFVFWSRTARPYAMAGMFVVLAWRWKWFMVPALLCSPIAIVGAHVAKFRSYWFWGLMALIALISYGIRPDVGERNFVDLSFIFVARRIWYVPALVVVLWSVDYLRLRRKRPNPGDTGWSEGGLVE